MCIYLINERDEALRDTFNRNAADICISSITYAELCFGVAHSAHVERNTRELEAFCLNLTSCRSMRTPASTTGRFATRWCVVASRWVQTIY